MKVLRWFGLYCFLLGMVACSTNPAVQHSKKTGGLQKSTASHYVGLKIPPMPKEHETELGYLLGPEDRDQYAVEVVNVGPNKLVWMGRLLYHDEKGRAHWEIIAALPPRPLPAGYQFSRGNCLSHGKPQSDIVAIFKMEDKKTLTQIHQAWKANPQKELFEPLPLEGIQCINERSKH